VRLVSACRRRWGLYRGILAFPKVGSYRWCFFIWITGIQDPMAGMVLGYYNSSLLRTRHLGRLADVPDSSKLASMTGWMDALTLNCRFQCFPGFWQLSGYFMIGRSP